MNTKLHMGRKRLGRLRLNITMSPEAVAALDAIADEMRKDRSRLLEEVVMEFVRKYEADRKPDPPKKPRR